MDSTTQTSPTSQQAEVIPDVLKPTPEFEEARAQELVDLEAVQATARAKESRSKRNREGKGRGSRAKDVKKTRKTWCENHQMHHTEKWCANHQRWEQVS